MLFLLFQNEKKLKSKKHENAYKLSKMDVYYSELPQDIVNTE